MWCITRHPTTEGSGRNPRSAREPAEPSSSRRGGDGVVGEWAFWMDPEHIASDVQHELECRDSPERAPECRDSPERAPECRDSPERAAECRDSPERAPECRVLLFVSLPDKAAVWS
jgi:hypothetical protein